MKPFLFVLFLIGSFFGSASMLTADEGDVFPSVIIDLASPPVIEFEGDRPPTIEFEGDHIPAIEFEQNAAEFLSNGYGILDNHCRNRIFAQYSRDGFRNMNDVRGWCRGFLTDFGLDFGRLNEFCGWERRGNYGRYSWNARFVYPGFSYRGNPQFYTRQFCD